MCVYIYIRVCAYIQERDYSSRLSNYDIYRPFLTTIILKIFVKTLFYNTLRKYGRPVRIMS